MSKKKLDEHAPKYPDDPRFKTKDIRKKMGREELLSYLGYWKNAPKNEIPEHILTSPKHEQAHKQIKKILEKPIRRLCNEYCDERGLDIISKDYHKRLKEQKPTVDEKFIEKWIEILKQERDGWIEYNCKHLVKQMLKEANVEVKK